MNIDITHDISERMYQLTLRELNYLEKKLENVIEEFTKTLKILINKIDDLKK